MDSNVQYSSHGKELAARMDKSVHFLECKLGIIRNGHSYLKFESFHIVVFFNHSGDPFNKLRLIRFSPLNLDCSF
jgi:hypothetical protein